MPRALLRAVRQSRTRYRQPERAVDPAHEPSAERQADAAGQATRVGAVAAVRRLRRAEPWRVITMNEDQRQAGT